ncbi:hypothetical protein H5410_015331 [Solanum commersonii]|uniref:Uncharacterized protein n=1 Tax=Solanum commersonii TaxID=4109 RepID=A0A9J5ZTT1_SOLCO|nr:hypothetical protein H5410_015331 [Solanum commersonii]
MIIMWELWRSSCSSKYEHEKPLIFESTSMISFNIFQLTKFAITNLFIPDDWRSLLIIPNTNLRENIVIPVKWIMPSLLFVKMNSDVSCVGIHWADSSTPSFSHWAKALAT